MLFCLLYFVLLAILIIIIFLNNYNEFVLRLGGGPNDAAEITGHPFFYGMDFEALLRKEIEPPFIPNLASDTDTSYFDAVSVLNKKTYAL